MNLISRHILQRVFQVKHGGLEGTGFVLNEGDRQYLLTADYVVNGIQPDTTILIKRNGTWSPISIGKCWNWSSNGNGADLALLQLKAKLLDPLPVLVGNEAEWFISQEAFFLGFPHGHFIDGTQANNGYPIPYVKHGIISGMGTTPDGQKIIVLDALNNPGFSGGPVVTIGPANTMIVIGVVSGYKAAKEDIQSNNQNVGLSVMTNTGLLVSYGIQPALEAIKADV